MVWMRDVTGKLLLRHVLVVPKWYLNLFNGEKCRTGRLRGSSEIIDTKRLIRIHQIYVLRVFGCLNSRNKVDERDAFSLSD